MDKEAKIQDIAEKLFIRKSGALLMQNDQNIAGNAAIAKNCLLLAELYVNILEERKNNERKEEK